MTIIAAIVAAFVIWLIAHPVAGIDLEVGKGNNDQFRTITAFSVIAVTAIAGNLAWASLDIFKRLTSHVRTRWTVFAVGVLLISFLGPLGGVTTGAIITMFAMHLAVGAILILGLRRTIALDGSESDERSN